MVATDILICSSRSMRAFIFQGKSPSAHQCLYVGIDYFLSPHRLEKGAISILVKIVYPA